MTLLYFLQQKIGLARRKIISGLVAGEIFVNNEPVSNKDVELHTGDIVSIHKGESRPEAYIVEATKKKKQKSEVILFNKPKGYVVSKDDPVSPTIYEFFPEDYKQEWYYIGRLDKDSHGLVALTNQTPVVNRFEHPSHTIKKEYIVKVDKFFGEDMVAKAKQGIYVDPYGKETHKNGDLLRVKRIKYQEKKNAHVLFITLTEGKKRHIRRLLRALGYKVKDLQRISIGEYKITGIRPGKRRKVPGPKIEEKENK